MSVRVIIMAICVLGHCICMKVAGAAKGDMATMRDGLKDIQQAAMAVNKVQGRRKTWTRSGMHNDKLAMLRREHIVCMAM